LLMQFCIFSLLFPLSPDITLWTPAMADPSSALVGALSAKSHPCSSSPAVIVVMDPSRPATVTVIQWRCVNGSSSEDQFPDPRLLSCFLVIFISPTRPIPAFSPRDNCEPSVEVRSSLTQRSLFLGRSRTFSCLFFSPMSRTFCFLNVRGSFPPGNMVIRSSFTDYSPIQRGLSGYPGASLPLTPRPPPRFSFCPRPRRGLGCNFPAT